MYDYLIVGAGLFGAICACEAQKRGKSVLVIDKRNHIAGNIYTEKIHDIHVHRYGAHIFHTNSKKAWDYICQFADFNNFRNSPIANYKGEIYSLPFNMYTFNKMWDVITPQEAQRKIDEQKSKEGIVSPNNLEEQAISLVGREIYEKLVKEYTEKQWGRPCSELPSFIIKRLPVRFSYDNNYFNALYQGIPIGGYTQIVEKMLQNVDVELGVDYFNDKVRLDKIAEKIVFTGAIDEYFNYCFGPLEYRSVHFENEVLEMENYQGNAVVNYTSKDVPWTRIIEHKWFDLNTSNYTVISKEYSREWKVGEEPYYPVNNEKNNLLYQKYLELAKGQNNVVFGGRLGHYKYYDMDAVILAALELSDKLF